MERLTKYKLAASGVEPEDLDDIVLDVGSEEARAANSGGIKTQLFFLSQLGYSEEEIWARILAKMLRVEMIVDVLPPKHPEAQHDRAYTGRIESITGDRVVVEAVDGRRCPVAFYEIERFAQIQKSRQSVD